jgi:hypothetical protein
MEMLIKGLTKYKSTYKTLNIFCYSTNGLPGLEIKIGSKNSKILKEKIVYLTRKSNTQVPIKRYVICIDEGETSLRKEEIKYLELPILILYWTMAGRLPISKLDDCICGGEISLEGTIRPLLITGDYLNYFNSVNCSKIWKIISTKSQKDCLGLLRLPVEEILLLPLINNFKSIGS